MFLLKDGLLCYLEYSVEIARGDKDQEVRASVTAQPLGSDIFSDLQNHRYGIDDGVVRQYIHRLAAAVSPEADPEEHRHAFQFDLACLTSFQGCRQPCEILPLVWMDYVKRSRDLGWRLPQEAENDPKCASLK